MTSTFRKMSKILHNMPRSARTLCVLQLHVPRRAVRQIEIYDTRVLRVRIDDPLKGLHAVTDLCLADHNTRVRAELEVAKLLVERRVQKALNVRGEDGLSKVRFKYSVRLLDHYSGSDRRHVG